MSLKQISTSNKEPVFHELADIIYDRYQDVLAHPEKKEIDAWDLSDCFYLTRKAMHDLGYDITPLNDTETKWRSKIYAEVRIICERDIGIKRHQAGIFPADRAVMAFNGQLYSVSFKNIELLRYWGPDVIYIEKEGIVEKLVPFTQHLGLALVHSQGFYSEYAEMLSQEVLRYYGNLGILTDFDASGINMGLKIKNSIRLGADLNTIHDLDHDITELQKEKNSKERKSLGFNVDELKAMSENIKIENLEETSLTKKGKPSDHWLGLYNTLIGKKKRRKIKEWTSSQKRVYFSYLLQKHNDITYIEYLRTKRIELNIIVDMVGALMFWRWLRKKILETFPKRNYNRAVETPKYIFTPTMEKFQNEIIEKTKVIVKDRREEIMNELGSTRQSFIVVKDKEKEIKADLLNNVILKNKEIKNIDSRLKDIMKNID